jgi:hypothetical protein
MAVADFARCSQPFSSGKMQPLVVVVLAAWVGVAAATSRALLADPLYKGKGDTPDPTPHASLPWLSSSLHGWIALTHTPLLSFLAKVSKLGTRHAPLFPPNDDGTSND